MQKAYKAPEFIRYLESLRDREDRGAIAALRRGLGKPLGTVFSMAPYVEPWVSSLSDRDRKAHYLIASLFASHPGRRSDEHDVHTPSEATPQNLGDVFAGIVRTDIRPGERYEDASRRTERRFVALLNADYEDLPNHLRHAVSLAKSRGVAMDYGKLLTDLRSWDSDTKWVQQRWASSFWNRKIVEVPAIAGDTEQEDLEDTEE